MSTESVKKIINAKTVTTGISGVFAKIINDSIVQLSIYTDTPITISSGALKQIGSTTLPAELRPPSNLNYLLYFARANNQATVLGIRVTPDGQVLGYNMNASETTYTSIYGVACYAKI